MEYFKNFIVQNKLDSNFNKEVGDNNLFVSKFINYLKGQDRLEINFNGNLDYNYIFTEEKMKIRNFGSLLK